MICTLKSVSPNFIANSRKRDVALVFPASAFGPQASGGMNCTLTIPILDAQHVSIPLHFIENRFGQNRVLDKNHIWHPIILIRSKGSSAIIDATQLAADTVLILPPQLSEK